MKITRRQLRQIIKEEEASRPCFEPGVERMHPSEFADMEPDIDDDCWPAWRDIYTSMGGVVDDEAQAARPDNRNRKIKITREQLRRLIKEELSRVLTEGVTGAKMQPGYAVAEDDVGIGGADHHDAWRYGNPNQGRSIGAALGDSAAAAMDLAGSAAVAAADLVVGVDVEAVDEMLDKGDHEGALKELSPLFLLAAGPAGAALGKLKKVAALGKLKNASSPVATTASRLENLYHRRDKLSPADRESFQTVINAAYKMFGRNGYPAHRDFFVYLDDVATVHEVHNATVRSMLKEYSAVYKLIYPL